MLSQTSEYALRAMVWLAGDWLILKEQPKNVSSIAKETQVPPMYLIKILQTLTKKGLLKKKRGLKGGFYLADTPQKISLLSIIELFDSIDRIQKCPLKLEAHKEHLCPLHSKLDELACSLRNSFSSMSLQDLVNRPQAPLCTH